jgi:uncharacterized membrane protein YidH (DUF202 family)
VFDPGAQNERTALAWQRTALSLMAGSAVLGRLTYDRLGLLSLAGVLIAFVLSCWVFWDSRGRYAHSAGVRMRRRGRGGRSGAALTLAVVLIALTELAAIIVSRT